MTLQEYVLGINSTEIPNIQLFCHFKKIWSKDPEDTVWVLSVHKSLLHEAERVTLTLEDTLRDRFGDVMDNFILPNTARRRNIYCPASHHKNSNDDDWFDDKEEEMDILFKTGIIVEGYKDHFSNKGHEYDHVSWDMNTRRKSTETEFLGDIMDNRASLSGTDVSSLTTSVTKEDIKHRTHCGEYATYNIQVQQQ